MKVTTGSCKKNRPYPKLMINKNGTIALHFKGEFTVLVKGGLLNVGDVEATHARCDSWTDYEGVVTLEND